MKELFSMFVAAAFALSMIGVAVAADNAAKPMKAAEKSAATAEKPAAAGKKSAKAARFQQMTGTVEALDASAGTFTVKGRKGNVDLKAGGKIRLGDVKVGDKVVVKHADGTASSLKAVKATRSAKKATAKAEKPADAAEKSAGDAKKAAPAPAAAPAPIKK
jgi:hypothetical protein